MKLLKNLTIYYNLISKLKNSLKCKKDMKMMVKTITNQECIRTKTEMNLSLPNLDKDSLKVQQKKAIH